MRKSIPILIGIIIVIALIVGGFAVFNNSDNSDNNNNTSTPSTSKNNQNKNNVPTINNAVLTTKTSSSLGKYLADPSGKALYTFSDDKPGMSNCTGSCLEVWPAYVAKGSTSNLPAGVSTITRTDNGQVQYTFNGMPLYYFVSDPSGQATGDGVENFKIARPAAASSSQSTSTGSPANNPSTGQSSTGSSSGLPY
jgi:predicted lipoprotein with Yx(FWY)xxD motif